MSLARRIPMSLNKGYGYDKRDRYMEMYCALTLATVFDTDP